MDAARHNWGWVLALGILLVLLGAFATSAAITTTMLTVLVIGVLLLIAGVVELGSALRNAHYGGFWMHLFTGILDLVCGALLVRYPAAGALTLTLVLAIFFLVGGGMRAISALMIDLPNGGWAVLSGIVDVILGIFLLTSWPVSGLWFLGLAVGIGLIFRGAWWAAFALAVRKLPTPVSKPM
ncbi:MAG: HdeD family acid-resistance protein [Verrucomicrobia bacterium]|nr:HdeD family acid-resistance protein [Verrucomicrobiota bacterium]